MNALGWDDLRLVLAIGRCGSLTGAATELGLNVSTCSRRLTQLETALSIICFVRRPSGVELTSAGRVVFNHAEAIEQQTISLGRSLACLSTSERPRVTVTCPDSLASTLVIPALRRTSTCDIEATVNLITDNRMMDLHRGEADIALRLRPPTEGGLRMRRITTVQYGMFASQAYLDENGAVDSLAALEGHRLIAIQSNYPNHPPAVWWAQHCAGGTVVVATDRTFDRQQCAQNSLGITMLPLVLGDASGLVRVLAQEKLPSLDVFMLAEAGALRVPAVRQVADRLADFAKRKAVEIALVCTDATSAPSDQCEAKTYVNELSRIGSQSI